MEVLYLKSFLHDLKKNKDQKLKAAVKSFIIDLKDANALSSIPGVVKLKGYTTAYRFRIGDYRIGFFKNPTGEIILVRCVKRSDIYKLFP